MDRVARIKDKLTILKPQYLKLIDQTSAHRGHLENDNQLETHLKLIIQSESLDDKTRINQHKIINKLLSDEFHNGLHALSIKIIEK
ncbi:MAG: BolA family protein [Rickettsiaceae bacterium]